MFRTITVGSCVTIQGQYVRDSDNGRVVIRVGKDLFVGKPVGRAA